MFFQNKQLLLAIVTFIILSTIIIFAKPGFLYDEEKQRFKNSNETYLTLEFTLIIIAIFSYVLSVYYYRDLNLLRNDFVPVRTSKNIWTL